ncbi:Hypothetical predicted protein [Mytilus galloprovincialis]|uniref:Uncharacterized protein n=1 Tax=Mytilus galloprovincialis TaxID=29158 RepID=A0A8B6ERY1_MYTGA|nr:Hypothetical predicted protein [Mytilus galloprovincialis]
MIKTDLNAVSVLLKQADNKNNKVQEFIQISDASKFFTEVNNLEKSIDIQIPEPRSSYGSLPNFIPEEITQSNIGVLEFDENLSYEPHVHLEINKQYQTELETVTFVSSSIEQTFWISSGGFCLVQKVKLDGNNIQVLSSYNISVYDTVYNLSPFYPTAVHITSDNKILVGGNNRDFLKQGRRVVILMNKNRDHERVYEHHQHKQPIFTYPLRITSTSNGNIHVVDGGVRGNRYRVVVLEQGGDLINIYTGDREINKDIPFNPRDIVTTPRDNVIVADINTYTLHILNNAGILVTCYKTSDINIVSLCSLVFTPTGQLYIGCSTQTRSKAKDAKLYEVTISLC